MVDLWAIFKSGILTNLQTVNYPRSKLILAAPHFTASINNLQSQLNVHSPPRVSITFIPPSSIKTTLSLIVQRITLLTCPFYSYTLETSMKISERNSQEIFNRIFMCKSLFCLFPFWAPAGDGTDHLSALGLLIPSDGFFLQSSA